MRALKTFLRNERVRRALCWLAAQAIRLVHRSGRWRVVGEEVPRRLWDAGRPFILCFWHGRLLMMPYCWRPGITVHTLISQHPDGRLLAHLMGHFGIPTLAGSTRRGGAAALRAMVRILKAGDCVAITPDGPQGPRMRADAGIVALARLAGAPIVPVGYGIDRRRVLATWDRFVVALPFGRGAFVWGEPIEVAADADGPALEAARRRVEASLNAVTAEADRLTGWPPIEPAPVAEAAGR